MMFSQVPHTLLMIRPASFGYNPETAASNAFQKLPASIEEVSKKAMKEFDEVVLILRKQGIDVMVIDDIPQPVTTDAVFPNNWISTHQDGKIILYPMMAPSRRQERRDDIVLLLKEKFEVREVIDLSSNEEKEKFLEGTGSIIFEHPNKIAYACRSARTNDELFSQLCAKIGYAPVLFEAKDENGMAVYHTNVMMWIGEKLAAICLDSLSDEDQEIVLDSFSKTGHRVIALSFQQMRAFAGNMFEAKNKKDQRFLLMSETAFESLLPGQLKEIQKYAVPLPLSIPIIEESGGGSIRCMVAGIHLPKSE